MFSCLGRLPPLSNTVHILPDVVHPPHSWSSFWPCTSHFHLHNLLHIIFFLHSQNVSIPAQPACLAFNLMFSTPKSPNFVAPLSVSASGSPLIHLNILISVVLLSRWHTIYFMTSLWELSIQVLLFPVLGAIQVLPNAFFLGIRPPPTPL